MKLFLSATSPYARKVTATAVELGIDQKIDLILVNPLESDNQLLNLNPLSKVPTLVLPDGRELIDSLVICLALIEQVGDQALLSTTQSDRLDLLNRHALANGMIDAAFQIVMERRRPFDRQSEYWIARWNQAITRSLTQIERTGLPEDRFDLADLTLAVAIEYLYFRLGDEPWLADHPRLSAWRDEVILRPSLAQTAPA